MQPEVAEARLVGRPRQCGFVVGGPTRAEARVELAGAEAVIEGGGAEALTR